MAYLANTYRHYRAIRDAFPADTPHKTIGRYQAASFRRMGKRRAYSIAGSGRRTRQRTMSFRRPFYNRRRRKTRFRRKFRNRRFRRRRARVSWPRLPPLVPPKVVRHHRLVCNDNSITQTVADTPVYWMWKLNDLKGYVTTLDGNKKAFTPGRDPYGVDQMYPLYNHYLVVDYRIQMYWQQQNSGVNTQNFATMVFHRFGGTDQISPANWHTIVAPQTYKYRTIGGNNLAFIDTAGPTYYPENRKHMITRPYKKFKKMQDSKDYYIDPDYEGSTSNGTTIGSPTKAVYLCVGICNRDAGEADTTLQCRVQVDLLVRWRQRVSQAES